MIVNVFDIDWLVGFGELLDPSNHSKGFMRRLLYS